MTNELTPSREYVEVHFFSSYRNDAVKFYGVRRQVQRDAALAPLALIGP
jgi:hypothetical protein